MAPVSRCVEYFRDEHARRDYRNMRVKRTLPPRTTVVKHEGATEGERIEHRMVGERETGDARGRMEDARVGGGGSRDGGYRPGGGSRARALQRVGGGRETRLMGGWLLVKGSTNQKARERRVRIKGGGGVRG